MSTVSVVVPVHGDLPQFRRALDALLSLDPCPWQIIVVNDGASPWVREQCRRRDVLAVETEVARGPASARNLGAAHATGEWLLFVDSDVLVPPKTLARVLSALSASPHLAAVFGSYDDAPEAQNFFSQYKNLFHHFMHQRGPRRAETFWSGLGAIHRDAFFAVGGFDSAYDRPSVEDIELGYRLRERGFEIESVPSLQAKHLKRWSAWSWLKTDFALRALPWTELLWRFPDRPKVLNLSIRERLSAVLAVALAAALAWSLAIGEPVRALAPGCMAWGWLNWPLFRFLGKRRGLAFAAMSVPCHWLYFLTSVSGFAIGTVRHFAKRPAVVSEPRAARIPWAPREVPA